MLHATDATVTEFRSASARRFGSAGKPPQVQHEHQAEGTEKPATSLVFTRGTRRTSRGGGGGACGLQSDSSFPKQKCFILSWEAQAPSAPIES